MITVSDKMKAYLKQTGRSFHGKIEVGDSVVYDGIMSIFIDRSVCTDELTLGNVNCAFAEISLYDCTVSLKGQEIKVYIAAEIDGEDEWIKVGTFIAEKPQIDEKLTTFTAYDSIKYKTDGTYFPSESVTSEDTAAVDAVFADICQQCGVLSVPLFSDSTAEADKPKIDPKKLNGQPIKTALGQIAGFMGGNLVCDADGKFTVRKFSDCDFVLDESAYSQATISENAFTVEKITCKTETAVLTSGAASGQGITFDNSLMTQERLDGIFDEIGGLSFCAISAENLVGNPCIEPGDVITVQKGDLGYRLPLMHVTTDFDGGIMNTVEAFAKTEEEKSGGLGDIKETLGTVAKENSEFAQVFNAALGLYTSKQTLPDGSVKFYSHNKPSLAESTFICTFNAGGFAFVKGEGCWNNGSPDWKHGVDADGNAILNYLNVNKLSADYIDVDTIFAKDIIASGSILSGEDEDGQKIMIDMANGEIRTDTTQENPFDAKAYMKLNSSRNAFVRGWKIEDVTTYDLLVENGYIEYSKGERTDIESNNGYLEILDDAQLSVYGLTLTRVYTVRHKDTKNLLSNRIAKYEIGFAKTNLPTIPVSSGGTGATDGFTALSNLGVQRSTDLVTYNPSKAYGSDMTGNGFAKIEFKKPYKSGTKPTVVATIVNDSVNPLKHALVIAKRTNEYFIVKYQHSGTGSESTSFQWIAIGTPD